MQIYNTFGLPASADQFLEFTSEEQLCQYLSKGISQPFLIIGGGSNMVFTSHFPGTVIHMANLGIIIQDGEEDEVFVTAAAGEEWDHFVKYCTEHNCHGAENMIAIPGHVGAAPVQNVGAYGMEAKDIIHTVRTIHINSAQPRIFTNAECEFGYRYSIFKEQLKDQYIITSVTFRLSHTFTPNIQYQALTDALARQGISTPTPKQLADTIAEVRWSKLPKPEQLGSAGSFFKNPIVSSDHYQKLLAQHPDIVAYPVPEGYKLAAGWLIQHAGWKGRSLGKCGVYEKQALVLVNHGGCTGQEVLALAEAIINDVQKIFGVTLEKEAIII